MFTTLFSILNVALPIIQAVQSHPAPTAEHHDLAADAADVGQAALTLARLGHQDAASPAAASAAVQELQSAKRVNTIEDALGLVDRARALLPGAAPADDSPAITALRAELAALKGNS